MRRLRSALAFIAMALGILFLAVCTLFARLFPYLYSSQAPLCALGASSLITSYTDGEFQDYSDYKIYHCEDPKLENNQFFAVIDETSLQILNQYIDDFERWVIASGEDSSLHQHYDFDCSIIDTANYFYIDDDTGTPVGSKPLDFSNYDVYFFDYQSSRLYFFHSNI